MSQMPAKQRVMVQGAWVEYVLAGEGSRTLVLINGAGGPVEGWMRVFAPLSREARVFAYNRPGIGRSDKPAAPQTVSRMLVALRVLLSQLGLRPPYVLVGHSFGGLIANLFARCHPEEVAAIVMLEATAPEDVGALAAHQGAVLRLLMQLLEHVLPPDPMAETAHAEESVEELEEAPAFPPIPLFVITGGKPAMSWVTPTAARVLRAAHQLGLVSLSPYGRQIIAPRSGHFPQLTEPQLVIEVIREALARIPC